MTVAPATDVVARSPGTGVASNVINTAFAEAAHIELAASRTRRARLSVITFPVFSLSTPHSSKHRATDGIPYKTMG